MLTFPFLPSLAELSEEVRSSSTFKRGREQGPDSGAKNLTLKTALKSALKMALDFLYWKKAKQKMVYPATFHLHTMELAIHHAQW